MAEPARTDEISASQLRQTLGPLYQDKRSRIPTVTKPEVIDLGSRVRNTQGVDMLQVGLEEDEPLITLFVARSGSGKLEVIRDAVIAGDGAQIVQDELLQQGIPEERSLREAVREMIAGSVYAEFRYADFALAEHIFLPSELELSAYVFPYNGARLEPSGFSLTQWHRQDSDPVYEALVVYNAPPRTEAESVAELDRPVIQNEKWCDTTWWGVAAGVAMAAAGAAAANGATIDTFDVANLDEEVRARLGETPAIDELIELRMFRRIEH